MPRPDGRLYEFEKDALKKEANAGKPKKRMGRPPKPKPEPIKTVIVRETFGEGLARVAKDLNVRTVPVAKNGRQLKASKELIEAIRDSVAKGLTIDKSCILHGIRSGALEKWKRANEDILHVFQQAELEGEMELVAIIKAAAPKDWKAANWLLERRHEWEQRSRQELTGPNGGPVLSVSQLLFASVAKGGGVAEPVKEKRVKATAAPVDRGLTILAQ